MAQQFNNGGRHDGSVTISIRDSRRYAVVNKPGEGKHGLSKYQIERRHERNIAYTRLLNPNSDGRYRRMLWERVKELVN